MYLVSDVRGGEQVESWNSLSGHELARPGSITYVEADAPVEF